MGKIDYYMGNIETTADKRLFKVLSKNHKPKYKEIKRLLSSKIEDGKIICLDLVVAPLINYGVYPNIKYYFKTRVLLDKGNFNIVYCVYTFNYYSTRPSNLNNLKLLKREAIEIG